MKATIALLVLVILIFAGGFTVGRRYERIARYNERRPWPRQP
jgi:hypothetical protein